MKGFKANYTFGEKVYQINGEVKVGTEQEETQQVVDQVGEHAMFVESQLERLHSNSNELVEIPDALFEIEDVEIEFEVA
ncbi:hypothetical protein BTR23_07570 [Alkalihalophilus pseudofirmus]|nr:hypothetical protein BTR23_07570 [Alkalihalophilus pseudofirmus]